MDAIQMPIVQVIGDLIREVPGTISLGQGVVHFGPPPAAVEALLEVVALRVAAKRLGVERIEARDGRAVLTFAPSTPVTPERILQSIAKSRGGMSLKKEYTVEARIPREPWPAVRDALGSLLASLA